MTLTACYDLACNPPTYDVVAFLAHAELERLRLGAEAIDLHILPGPSGGFRRDSLWPRGVEERVALRDNLLAPLCWLLPNMQQVAVDHERWINGFGKSKKLISLPHILAALRQGCRPLRPQVPPQVRSKLVTLTLREAAHHPLRNSRVEEWVRAAVGLRGRGFDVVVVRDTVCAHEPLAGTVTCPEASLNVECRAELYATAVLNVGINNGPMWMALLMDVPVLMLRPTTNSARGGYDDKFYARCGLPRGSQLPTSPPHQRLVWEEDYCDNIVRAVEDTLCTVG